MRKILSKTSLRNRAAERSWCGLILLLTTLTSSPAEEFSIQIGDTISPGVPGLGAGRLESDTDSDIYTFTANARQIIFAEEISVAPEYKGWLSWDLRSPGGASLYNTYFEGNHEGRKVLPETGTYTLRFRVLSRTPEHFGDYSFRLRAVDPDDVFTIQLGDTVANGAPGEGAGSIEQAGAQDVYEFQATAGQEAFFEEISAAQAFEGWLQWEVRAPGGATVFRSYIGGGQEGKKLLPETGKYTLRVWVGINKLSAIGEYSFRIRPIAGVDEFTIQIGQTVSNGVPAQGAGNIEMPGATDRYTFQGTAGENVFFETLAADASLKGWLQWVTKTPGGQTLFTTYLTPNSNVGRKTLPETGTYTMTFSVGSNEPDLIGTYGFRLGGIGDSRIPLEVGTTISSGSPAAGAGVIDEAGEQDLYTFHASAGQKVVFEQLDVAQAFGGWLRWRVTTPSSNEVFVTYMKKGENLVRYMPETGNYTVRVWPDINNPQAIGAYSFRLYSDVYAWPDQFVLTPNKTLAIPEPKLRCNDRQETLDVVTFDLPATNTAQGGTLVYSNNVISYTPPAGFTGEDTFTYRLRGKFGGEDLATATIRVYDEAEQQASIVSYYLLGSETVQLCILGLPNQDYKVESSSDLQEWDEVETVSAGADGSLTYEYELNKQLREKYYRFVRAQ